MSVILVRWGQAGERIVGEIAEYAAGSGASIRIPERVLLRRAATQSPNCRPIRDDGSRWGREHVESRSDRLMIHATEALLGEMTRAEGVGGVGERVAVVVQRDLYHLVFSVSQSAWRWRGHVH